MIADVIKLSSQLDVFFKIVSKIVKKLFPMNYKLCFIRSQSGGLKSFNTEKVCTLARNRADMRENRPESPLGKVGLNALNQVRGADRLGDRWLYSERRPAH